MMMTHRLEKCKHGHVGYCGFCANGTEPTVIPPKKWYVNITDGVITLFAMFISTIVVLPFVAAIILLPLGVCAAMIWVIVAVWRAL